MNRFAKYKKSKRLLAAFLAAAALSLTACGGDENAKNIQTASQEQTAAAKETAAADTEPATEEKKTGVDTISLYLDHKDTGIHELAEQYS